MRQAWSKISVDSLSGLSLDGWATLTLDDIFDADGWRVAATAVHVARVVQSAFVHADASQIRTSRVIQDDDGGEL